MAADGHLGMTALLRVTLASAGLSCLTFGLKLPDYTPTFGVFFVGGWYPELCSEQCFFCHRNPQKAHPWVNSCRLMYRVCPSTHFYQRVSIASYASAGIARPEMSVRLSVRLSVTLWYCIKTKKASVMISSPSESLNILVSRNIWFITKFDRVTPSEGDF